MRQASDDAARCAELGDLFFALVNLTRWLKIAAETVLREANARFKTRFSDVGRTARERGKLLSEMNLEALDALWDEAKESSSQIEYSRNTSVTGKSYGFFHRHCLACSIGRGISFLAAHFGDGGSLLIYIGLLDGGRVS